MTREEAIKELRRLHYAYKADEHGDYFYDNADDVCQAAALAIAALREQEERSKGCEWCKKDRVLCWDSGGEEVCIANQGKLPVLGTDDWGFAIKFCPMCGRRLEEV